MFKVGDAVQIVNHTEYKCNGQYGVIESQETIRGTVFYEVALDDAPEAYCTATADELMEG